MRLFLLWMVWAVGYFLGMQIILGVDMAVKEIFGEMGMLFQISMIAVSLVSGGGLIYGIQRHYRLLLPDSAPLLWRGGWQRRETVWAAGYAVLLILVPQLYAYACEWFGLPNHNPENQQILEELFRRSPVLLMIYAGLLAPVAEELLCRGMLSKVVQQYFDYKILIIFITSFVFALPHAFPNDLDFIVYFSMGAILWVCYRHTGQIKYPILAHMLNNWIALLPMWLEWGN